jgi:hypothetical protein
MNINSDKATYQPPYSVVLLVAMDAYCHEDVIVKMELFATSGGLGESSRSRGWAVCYEQLGLGESAIRE